MAPCSSPNSTKQEGGGGYMLLKGGWYSSPSKREGGGLYAAKGRGLVGSLAIHNVRDWSTLKQELCMNNCLLLHLYDHA